jgi:hypothetical protein
MKLGAMHRSFSRAGGLAVVVCALALAAFVPAPNSSGISGYSGKSRGMTCNTCHDGGVRPNVAISGPQYVLQNSQRSFGLTIFGGQQMGGGLDVATDAGTLVATDRGTTLMRGEITHTGTRNADRNGDVSWGFDLLAPAAPATVNLFGAGCSVDEDGRAGGDKGGAATAAVTVVDNLTRFVPYGRGLAGSGGVVPTLGGTDGPSVGPWSIEIGDGLGGASGILLLGVAPADVFPFFGGHLYVDLTSRFTYTPFVLGGAGGRAGAGSLAIRGSDVSGYAPLVLYFQAEIFDRGAPRGVALTNGLEMHVEK